MKHAIKLSKKDLKEGLMNYEVRVQTFEKFHSLTFLNYLILLPLYFLINKFTCTLISLYFIVVFVFVFFSKIYIWKRFQLDNFEFLVEDHLNKVVENFTSYFFTKGKRRDNKQIEHILNRIEIAENHFRKYDKLYRRNNFLSLICLYIEGLVLFILISEFSSGRDPNFSFFNTALIIISFLSVYLMIAFIVRNTHIKNLENSKMLFKKSISKVLDDLTLKIENIALFSSQEGFNISIKENQLLTIIQEWFTKYLGNFQDDLENNQLLFKYRDLIIDRKKEEYYLSLFQNIKTKLHIFNSLFEKITENEKIQVEKRTTLQQIVNETINTLKFNINNKKSIKVERREIIKDFFIIFSNILSGIALFFSLG